jgi:glutaminyl-peptide cyclotransferase
MKAVMKFFLGILFLATLCCQKKSEAVPPVSTSTAQRAAPDWQRHGNLTYEVIKELPHDTSAYTQGLQLWQGYWLEGTGGHGETSIRRIEKNTGRVVLQKDLSREYFGEGITELNGKLYQLTWKNQVGFVYDAKTFQWQKNFSYSGEGWGLTTDGTQLIMSNGSDRLRFLDPNSFRVTKEIAVRQDGKAITQLNELEFIEGEIFANIWFRDEIVRINPADGTVLGIIDLTGIDATVKRRHPDHVLNGIAYDATTGELFVTGKCWPKIYQIRLIEKK